MSRTLAALVKRLNNGIARKRLAEQAAEDQLNGLFDECVESAEQILVDHGWIRLAVVPNEPHRTIWRKTVMVDETQIQHNGGWITALRTELELQSK